MILAQSLNFSQVLGTVGLGGTIYTVVMGIFMYVVIFADLLMLVLPKPANSLFNIVVVIGLLTALLIKVSINGGNRLINNGFGQDLLTPHTLSNFIVFVIVIMCQVISAGTVDKANVRTWGVIAAIAAILALIMSFATAA